MSSRILGQLLGRLYLSRSLRTLVVRHTNRCFGSARASAVFSRNGKIVSLCAAEQSHTTPNSYVSSNFYCGFHSSASLCEDSVVVKTPPFAESVTEGDIRWDKAVGDAVAEDEVVGEIETDKVWIFSR
ncbi:dihydrolipoyllysine-residue succinyltransferase component of 2-oxoglutarate dehydrogenase complex, mitochondrial [Exaiptasia diaphana]|uniref:Lipoyl-binding domain-containing protein n=1 Tax=Exaiptasia diaphana TaxID=2652724 RepID=A0A913XTC0_EXADI|nr:dihydrolipoyllysine-residue succinyltransferase component of 2-oxoglutarate dehydrogenase complex, mitochondrial [Exaiptasia diaphana]